MKKTYQWAGLILIVIACIFFIFNLIENWPQLSTNFFSLDNLPTLITVQFLYLICFAITSVAWYNLLNSVGEKPKLSQILTTILMSQFAKYIPGNFSHHVGRVVLARNIGLSDQSIIITMTFEIIIVIIAAGVTGVTSIILGETLRLAVVSALPDLRTLYTFLTLIILALAILFKPMIFKYIKSVTKNLCIPKIRSIFVCYLLYTASFLLFGEILYLITLSYPTTEPFNYWILTASFSIAWILGFITPGAPAGLGIREAVLISILNPIYGSGIALSMAVTLRMVTTLGDGLGFLIGVSVHQWRKTNANESS